MACNRHNFSKENSTHSRYKLEHDHQNNIRTRIFLNSQLIQFLRMNSTRRFFCLPSEVYNSDLSPEVILLRKYRDEILLSSRSGEFFVELYYFFSPAIAKFISQQKLLKKIVKLLILNPIVKKLKKGEYNG